MLALLLFMKYIFIKKDWFTPNTYDTNYKDPPPKKGIYLFFAPFYNNYEGKIIYVGSTTNLKQRYIGHEVKDKAQKEYYYLQFFFIETDNYLEIEKQLIKLIKPQYNKQWLKD